MTTAQVSRLARDLMPARPTRGDLERRLVQVGIGVLVGLRDSGMTIEQAGRDLFNLRVYQAARKLRVRRELIEFLEWGMELDDVAEIAPRALGESLAEMERLLRRVVERGQASRA